MYPLHWQWFDVYIPLLEEVLTFMGLEYSLAEVKSLIYFFFAFLTWFFEVKISFLDLFFLHQFLHFNILESSNP